MLGKKQFLGHTPATHLLASQSAPLTLGYFLASQMVGKSLREQAPYRLPSKKERWKKKMNYPYFKVSASDETKEIFNNFYNQNKGFFGSKANMFRVMVSNLPV
ncbi:TPA: hypothetical protein ACOA77_002683, partial [Enterococcus faecium]